MKSFSSPFRRRGPGMLVAALSLASSSVFAFEHGIMAEKTGLAAANAAVDSHEVYRFDNTEINRAEIKAALKRVDDALEQLSAKMHSATEPMAKHRLTALRERRDDLQRNFRKASYDALVTDVQAEWRELTSQNTRNL